MVFSIGMAALPEQAAAQDKNIVQCESALPGAETETYPPCDLCQLISVIDRIFTWAAYLLVGLTVIMILVAGFMYVTAAGSPARIEQAKKTLIFAIIGLVVVILAFVIVSTIITILQPGSSFWSTFKCDISEIGASTT